MRQEAFAAAGCAACPVRAEGLCRHLSVDDRSLLHIAPRHVGPGSDLFYQGEPSDEVFRIREGWAFLYELLEDGRRQIVQFVLPGDLVGFHPEVTAPSFGAQAVNSMELCVIPRLRLVEVAHRRPNIAYQLACMFSHDEARAYDRLTSVGRKTAIERIASLLLELFYRLRRRAPEAPGEMLKLPLTQTHIADALGLTPVHTNRTLALLRQKGVIDYGNGLFHILAPAKLFAIAGIDPGSGAEAATLFH